MNQRGAKGDTVVVKPTLEWAIMSTKNLFVLFVGLGLVVLLVAPGWGWADTRPGIVSGVGTMPGTTPQPQGEGAFVPETTPAAGTTVFLPQVLRAPRPALPAVQQECLRWLKQNRVLLGPGSGQDSQGAFAPQVVRLDDGRFRLYYAGFDGQRVRILSAISEDGTQWSREAGVRLGPWGNYVAVEHPDVVRLADGRWRMYFSARTSQPVVANLHVAISTDGLAWQVEGLAVSHGGTYDTQLARSPVVAKNRQGGYLHFPGGVYRMFYDGYDGHQHRILSATSRDGVVWQKEGVRLASDVMHFADPDVVALGDGSLRLLFVASRLETSAAAASPEVLAPDQLGSGTIILSALSLDGLAWLVDEGLRLDHGDSDDPDSDGVFSPAVTLTDTGPVIYFTASDGQIQAIMSAAGMPGNAPPLSHIHLERTSVAQGEIVAAYDVTSFPAPLLPNLFLMGSIMRQGETLPNFTISKVPIAPGAGTARLDTDFVGNNVTGSDSVQLQFWQQIGETCPSPNVCYPVGYTVYQETKRDVALWLPGRAATVTLLDAREWLPEQDAVLASGPYLTARVKYTYRNVWGGAALIDLEALRSDGSKIELETTPAVIYPTQDVRSGLAVVAVPVKYTGTQSSDTVTLRAVVRVGLQEIASATKSLPKRWQPLATGSISSLRVEQDVSHTARVIVGYTYTPLAGHKAPAWLKATVLQNGVETPAGLFRATPIQVTPGSGEAAIEVRYLGESGNYATQQVRVTFATDGWQIEEREFDKTIPWQMAERGEVAVVPGPAAVREMPRNGSELEVQVRYTYDGLSTDRATLRFEAQREGVHFAQLPEEELEVSPGDGVARTVQVHYGGAGLQEVSDRIRITLVSKRTGEVLDTYDLERLKIWNPPSTGKINSVAIQRVNDWKADVTVNYDYNSPLDEPAWLSTTWYERFIVPPPLNYRDDVRYFFDETLATLQEGTSRTATLTVYYTGSLLNLKTDVLRVDMQVGRLEPNRITGTTQVDTNRRWSPPPEGTVEAVEVTDVDGRNITVQAKYSLQAGTCTSATLRVEVWKSERRGPAADFSGDTPISCTGSSGVTVTAPVSYTGDVPYLQTTLLRLRLYVNGLPVRLNDGKDLRSTFEFAKEWYTNPPGFIGEPHATWISPREMAVQLDYNYPQQGVLQPAVTLRQDGDDVSARFDIDIWPATIVSPADGKTGKLNLRLRLKDEYTDAFTTDELEVRLKTLNQTKLAQVTEVSLPWQEFEHAGYRAAYSIGAPQFSSDGVTLEAGSIVVDNPLQYDVGLPHGAYLAMKPILWRNNVPYLKSDDEDQGEFLLDYTPDNWIGSGHTVNNSVSAAYAKPVGSPQFDDVSLVLYAEDLPVYSSTFAITPIEMGRFSPPDAIVNVEFVPGLYESGTSILPPASDFVRQRGEALLVVTYAKNSDIPGMAIWPVEFQGEGSGFYPFELVSDESVPVDQGLGAAIFKFRAHDAWIASLAERSAPISWSHPFGDIYGTITFEMGVPGQDPVARKGIVSSHPVLYQLADVGEPAGRAKPFPNTNEIFNISYYLPPDSPYQPPIFMGAIALKDGAPLPGMTMLPVVIESTGTGTISSDIPLVLSYESSDVPDASLTADEIMVFLYDAQGQEKAPFYRETFPFAATWTKTVDEVKVATCETLERTETEPPRISVTFDYELSQASLDRVNGYNGTVKAWAEGLKFSEAVGAMSDRVPITQAGADRLNLIIKLEEGVAARTTHVGVYLEGYGTARGEEARKEGLARTTVECASLLVNEDAYLVASLDTIEINNDGDTVTKAGEIMLGTLGVSSEDMKQSGRWPIETQIDARWRSVDDSSPTNRLVETKYPLFTQPLYQLGAVIGLYVGVIEDDSMPAWVGTLIQIVTQVASIVANAFGQAEIATALQVVGNFVDKLLDAGSMPDMIDGWGVHLNIKDRFGVDNGGLVTADEGAFKKQHGAANFDPQIRMEILTLPPEDKPITVRLKKIIVHNCGDDWGGEIIAHTRVMDGLSAPVEAKYGPKGRDDGETWTMDKTLFTTNRAGPYLYVEVDVWDEDEPVLLDDNDLLGIAVWRLDMPNYGSDISDPDCNGAMAQHVSGFNGDVTVCIEVTSP